MTKQPRAQDTLDCVWGEEEAGGDGEEGLSMSKTAGEPCHLKMHTQYNFISGKQILSFLQTKDYKA